MSRTEPFSLESKSGNSATADGKSAAPKRVRFRIVSVGDMTDTTVRIIDDEEDGMFDYSSDSGTFIDEDSIMTPDHTAYYCSRSSGFASSKHASSPLVGSFSAASPYSLPSAFKHTISPPMHWCNNHDTKFCGPSSYSAPKIPSYATRSTTSSLPTVLLQSRPIQHLEYDFVSSMDGSTVGSEDGSMWIDITK
jgi:hypothetical protein